MDRPATDERPDPTGEVIAAVDIEELEMSVDPWRFDMRQMSRGAMDARIQVGLVGDILATCEHWSKKIVAKGASPPGYLALAGTGSRTSFKWCGHEIDSRHLVCGLDAAECDFVTPDREFHWVLLIPHEAMASYLGLQMVESLRGRRVLRCAPELSSRLFALANRAVQPSTSHDAGGQPTPGTMVLRAELLESAAQLISGENGNRRHSKRRQRYRIYRQAVGITDRLRRPISVVDIASELGVSRRTLERAFHETLGISPYKFTRLHRFNRLRRDLRTARGRETSVTQLLTDWGFTELGRTAVEYKSLFGESPSTTLAQGPSAPGLRLADALDGAEIR